MAQPKGELETPYQSIHFGFDPGLLHNTFFKFQDTRLRAREHEALSSFAWWAYIVLVLWLMVSALSNTMRATSIFFYLAMLVL